ncbi:E3 ubiquitin-protein ligase sina-like [Schistocerca cancellata]|uniref:E3 ubiquitin-protein ligase sina-like n=1 Tax=Schistocerca cancellata TaxID=274614 RepID=UPI0021183D75|nr:E3 ubiquitin-protein ligase sina-like [Schistocerca cancellata]
MEYLCQDLLDMLRCQVCWETLTRPIFRCKFEHLLCQQCFQKVTQCPSCREPLQDNLRSLSMERLADIVRSPCKYREVGCPEVLLLKTKRHHEEACTFRLCSPGAVEQYVGCGHRDQPPAAPNGVFRLTVSSTTVLEFKVARSAVHAASVPTTFLTPHYSHVTTWHRNCVLQNLTTASRCAWIRMDFLQGTRDTL